MDVHMSYLGTLIPEEPCCVFYPTRWEVYWGLTHVFFLLVLWFDITHIHTHTHKLKYLAKLAFILNDWAVLWVVICLVHLTVCFCHVTYVFQNESILYSCLNVKELLAWSRHKIWSLSDCNWTQTHNHLVHKWTLKHLAKLLQARSSLTFRQLECGFTLKCVCDITGVNRGK